MSELMLKALQPDILCIIIQFSGVISDFSKIFTIMHKRKLLEQWFKDIHIQTPFFEVTDSDLSLLWVLYQRRISNAPPRDLLKKALKQGLNCYFSNQNIDVFIRDEEFDLLDYKYLYCKKDEKFLEDINMYFQKDLIAKKKTRIGDIVFIKSQNEFRASDTIGEFIYDGQSLVAEDISDDCYDHIIPSKFLLNNFPVPNYFDSFGYFDTTDTQVKLIKEVKLKTLTLYHYITTGKYKDYEIWTLVPLTEENFKGTIVFEVLHNALFTDDIKNNMLKDKNILTKKIIKELGTNQNSKVLYQPMIDPTCKYLYEEKNLRIL